MYMDEFESRMNDMVFVFFNDTATTEIYTLSLHDALPIWRNGRRRADADRPGLPVPVGRPRRGDRKSTRLNSSHANISYAVFCLKKKKDLLTLSVCRYLGDLYVSSVQNSI